MVTDSRLRAAMADDVGSGAGPRSTCELLRFSVLVFVETTFLERDDARPRLLERLIETSTLVGGVLS